MRLTRSVCRVRRGSGALLYPLKMVSVSNSRLLQIGRLMSAESYLLLVKRVEMRKEEIG
jgi:hypothetical protein